MTRKLASIQKIINLSPIQGADRIEAAEILGWEVVVKKGDFQIGELVCYMEIDSWLPPHEAYNDFMAATKMRVKTRKFRKQISQGLCLPISDFPELAGKNWKEGDDVTELLKVTKWEPTPSKPHYKLERRGNPQKNWVRLQLLKFDWYRALEVKLFGKSGRNFPTWLVPKTDETRIQAAPGLLRQALIHEETGSGLYKTEKLDGTSATYVLERMTGWKKLFKPYKFYICSRNLQKFKTKVPKASKTFDNNGQNTLHDGNCYVAMATKYNIEKNLAALSKRVGTGLAIQGEIIGPTIQKNKYKLNQQELFLFNVYDVEQQEYLNFHVIIAACNELGIQMVPVLDENYTVKDKTVKDVVEEAVGKSVLNKQTEREGFVVRAKNAKKVSFKSISRKFLLKNDE